MKGNVMWPTRLWYYANVLYIHMNERQKKPTLNLMQGFTNQQILQTQT